MAQYVLGVAAAVAVFVFVVEMLRRGIIAEKFAALWLVVSAGLLVFAVFPGTVGWLATRLGFTLPANLLFTLSALLLLIVGIQLSHEIGRLEQQTRRLAQDVALLHRELESLKGFQAKDPEG